jgi:Carboxypeptidase regulatory-like domain
MRSLPAVAAASVATLVLAACAGGPGTSAAPTGPTPSAATVAAVVVTSAAPTGASFQLRATARLSDGTTRDVTPLASWSSSDPSIATVTTGGMALILRAGRVELRATFESVTGALAMDVAIGFTLSGRAVAVGGDSAPLAGVQVRITGGSSTSESTRTDASGRFAVADLAGLVSVDAALDGYLPWHVANLTVDHDLTLDVVLYPTPPADASGATATARCRDGSWSWATTVAEACATNGGILYGVCPGALCAATRALPIR